MKDSNKAHDLTLVGLMMILIISIGFFAAQAQAQDTNSINAFTIKSNPGAACTTKEGYEQVMDAVLNQDNEWFEQLVDGDPCIIPRVGLRGYWKERSIFGMAEVYIIAPNGERILFYVNGESFRKGTR